MNINRAKILKGVDNIINESMGFSNGKTNTTSIFNLNKNISYLLESCKNNKDLVQVLVEYKGKLAEKNQILLLESFIQSLNDFKSNSKVEKVRNNLIDAMNENRQTLQIAYLYESLEDKGVKNLLKESYSNYLLDQDLYKPQLNMVLESVSNIGNQNIDKMYSILNNGASLSDKNYKLFESSYTEFDNGKSIDVESLRKNIHAFVNEALDKAEEEKDEKSENECGGNNNECGDNKEDSDDKSDNNVDKEDWNAVNDSDKYTLNDIANKNGINLMESIIRLKKKTSNQKLHNILDEYYNALTNNAYEERLYETFYSNLSNYSYLLPVETEMSALNKRINAVKQDIDLTKLLEMMQATSSYYIVPLIEHQVVDYIKNKTPNKKQALIFGLRPYAHDPYVRQILECVILDDSKEANVMGESVLSKADRRKLILENASVVTMYSPIQYIKENESVFNLGGIFYEKKGNFISRLDNTQISKLDEGFVELCQLVNDPRVHIHDNNTITIDNASKTCVISEGSVSINGNIETSNTLRNLNEMYNKYNDYDTEFYIMATCLFEHFNDIAKVDFVKRVVLNEDNSYSLDLFNVNSNLFISTHNDVSHSHIFYRNVNPIQCKNIINEHMGLNVSSLFEDMLPNQKAILEALEETKETYEEKIEELRNLKDDLQAKADECEDEKDKKKLEDAIKDCEKDIEDAEKEFKDWQEESDKAVNGDKKDADTGEDDSDEDSNNVKVEKGDEPKDDVSDEDINDYSQSLSGDTTPADDTLEDIFPEEELGSEELSDEDIADVPDYNKEDMGPRDFDTEDGLPNLDAADEEIPEEDMDDEFAPEDEEDINNDFSEEDFVNPDELPDDETEEPEEFNDSDEDFENRFNNHADKILDDFDEEDDVETEIPEAEVNVDTDESKVTGIYFDENVKTGTILKSGTISITEPMVGPDGNKYIETKNIKFYIDDNNRAILNNEEISAELYNKALAAIENNPKFEEVIEKGEPSENQKEIDYSAEKEYPDDDVDLDMSDEIDIPEEDLPENDYVDIPTYKDGETDIELPADNIEFEEIENDNAEGDLIQENKKAILGITSRIKNGNKVYSLTEGKVRKSSTKKTLKF